ncbi:MAG: DUF362 domain-containing protein [Oscillospiraceae bacterium]|nr:DUF362 domain-containing protein [Oscillospiraceae bacterium]
MSTAIFCSKCPADAAWDGAVSALLDRIAAEPLVSDAVVAVKLDLTARDIPPALLRALCGTLRARGASVFVTDCAPFDGDALSAYETARALGYTPEAIGADFVLADGVKGTDYDLIPMRGGKLLRSTKVGRALSDADCIVTLSRAAVDDEGYRGVLHAVGFGCGARPGKVDMLTTGQPVVDPDKCIGCGKCTGVCEHGGTRIDPETGKAFIFKPRCAGCSRCMRVCPVDAIHPDYNASDERVRMKIAEVAKSMCDHRACLHFALCGDALLAAADPTALDAGCADLLGADAALRVSIDHAAGMGLGTTDYRCERV